MSHFPSCSLVSCIKISIFWGQNYCTTQNIFVERAFSRRGFFTSVFRSLKQQLCFNDKPKQNIYDTINRNSTRKSIHSLCNIPWNLLWLSLIHPSIIRQLWWIHVLERISWWLNQFRGVSVPARLFVFWYASCHDSTAWLLTPQVNQCAL